MSPLRGKPALLPPPGHVFKQASSRVDYIVSPVGESGESLGSYDFSGTNLSDSVRIPLIESFARLTGANGQWRRRATCKTNAGCLRALIGVLAKRRPPLLSTADLTPELWKFLVKKHSRNELTLNQLRTIRSILEITPGVPEATIKCARVRLGSHVQTKEASYSETEFERIRQGAQAALDAAEERIAKGRAILNAWREGSIQPETDEWRLGQLLDELVRTGGTERPANCAFFKRLKKSHGLGCIADVRAMVFIKIGEAFAAAILLVHDQAWNASVVDNMEIPTHEPDGATGATVYTVTIHKPRRGVRNVYTSNNLVDSGRGSSGYLLAQILRLTAFAREACRALHVKDNMLITYGGGPKGRETLVHGVLSACDNRAFKIDDDAGRPIQISLRRLRRTHQVLNRQPRQNTQHTHEHVYLLTDEQARSTASVVVTQALEDALAHAAEMVKMRWSARSVSPRLDTPVAACKDFLHSPFGDSEQGCRASFLMCFACSNGTATKRHLPKLVCLYDALEQLRSSVSDEVWELDWLPSWARIKSFLESHTTDAERDRARSESSENQRASIARLLDRGFDVG